MSSGATATRPDRLVIWLHPSGGRSFNAEVEALIPVLLGHRCALMVITEKSFQGWTDEEAARLFRNVFPEVAAIDGIDARKPILMGFSGGGQLAITLWHAHPEKFGGVILDAAYPLEVGEKGQSLMELPAGESVTKVPLFVLVGEKDGVAATWKKVESKWKEAGVPLTVRFVAGKGHQWLFGPDETAALDGWLATAFPE